MDEFSRWSSKLNLSSIGSTISSVLSPPDSNGHKTRERRAAGAPYNETGESIPPPHPKSRSPVQLQHPARCRSSPDSLPCTHRSVDLGVDPPPLTNELLLPGALELDPEPDQIQNNNLYTPQTLPSNHSHNHHHNRFQCLAALESELCGRDETISKLRSQLQTARTRNAHQFSTLEDVCSGADVIAHVRALNAEIFQLATFAAEQLAAQASTERIPFENHHEPHYRLIHALSPSGVTGLSCVRHEDDPTLLQIAFQAALSKTCQELVHSWGDRAIVGSSQPLSAIYEIMKQNEPQSVFARWRALTHKHINQISANRAELQEGGTFIRQGLKDAFLGVVVLARFDPDPLLKPDSLVENYFTAIEEHVQHVRDSIHLEMFSAEMELIFVSPEAEFDPQHMERGYNDQTPSGPIACTTALGMSKKVIDGDEDGGVITLVKPEIFFESSLVKLVVDVQTMSSVGY